MDSSVSSEDEIWILRVCHHISIGLYQKLRGLTVLQLLILQVWYTDSRLQLKCDGTRWRMGGEVKGKLANSVGSQYPSHYLGTWCIQHYYRWCAHLGCQQSTELTPLADLNGLVRFAERRNLVYVRVPLHFKRSLSYTWLVTSCYISDSSWVAIYINVCTANYRSKTWITANSQFQS